MGLASQDRSVVAVAEPSDGAGRRTQRHHLGGQPANGDTVSLWTKLALESARARRSAEGAKARSRAASKAKGLGTNLSLPPKLLPSRETGRGSGAELFLCEGDSALGTIKAARDATFQAAFPLKGKPPNVYGFALSKARLKDEFDSIERILGCGVRPL